MKTLCACGYDCSDFIEHHQIASEAQIQCPACENAIRVVSPTCEAGPELISPPRGEVQAEACSAG